jgi:hypothetical protein
LGVLEHALPALAGGQLSIAAGFLPLTSMPSAFPGRSTLLAALRL